ncbi:unnamed protein product [marine sediment metagenome]|uniref:Uncharacterized protein n=1 Tax=marine sediment metagenome TaxID=412755 RepID=X1DQ22_9ZZZZ
MEIPNDTLGGIVLMLLIFAFMIGLLTGYYLSYTTIFLYILYIYIAY